ncbi:hypothetical protein DPMN_084590 [Dreissena polymorpha]|uniref:Uncharacterized protein n=1 Tax=Dreissena polymorpha TaxID=45954 RepID=A0A9D4BL12_DREPO|nr:hypothetical protein DPMN_084590 [Dreissena polymorpha]
MLKLAQTDQRTDQRTDQQTGQKQYVPHYYTEKKASEKHDQKLEIEHCKTALRANSYPEWMFTIPKKKDKTLSDKSTNKNQKINIGMPYINGTSEALHCTEHSRNMGSTGSIDHINQLEKN